MSKKWYKMFCCGLIVFVAVTLQTAMGLTVEGVITVAADHLVAQQQVDGSWPGEADYTGPIVSGLVRAYRITGADSYLTAAELAGDFIIAYSGGNFLGDEVYALTRLSEVSADPNYWLDNVEAYYQAVKDTPGGTLDYISYWFSLSDPSTDVFYLAHHVLAAYYVEADDRHVWRDVLIWRLGVVEDGLSAYPVQSLGVAVLTLVQTGSMDDTLINPSAGPGSYWYQVALEDLPDMLAGHQVPQAVADPGSFYWRFDHTDGGRPQFISGHTEDTVFGTLGLIAVTRSIPTVNYESAIRNGQDALIYGVASDGRIYEHIWNGGAFYYVYAGETLQTLPLISDLDRDDDVDLKDLADFCTQWLDGNCGDYEWCGGADIDHSGSVDFADFAILSNWWLESL
jgi:hypothetical protein